MIIWLILAFPFFFAAVYAIWFLVKMLSQDLIEGVNKEYKLSTEKRKFNKQYKNVINDILNEK